MLKWVSIRLHLNTTKSRTRLGIPCDSLLFDNAAIAELVVIGLPFGKLDMIKGSRG